MFVLSIELFHRLRNSQQSDKMSVVAFKRSNKVNPDLANERKKCSFNTEEFTNWWYGGAKKVEEKRARGE